MQEFETEAALVHQLRGEVQELQAQNPPPDNRFFVFYGHIATLSPLPYPALYAPALHRGETERSVDLFRPAATSRSCSGSLLPELASQRNIFFAGDLADTEEGAEPESAPLLADATSPLAESLQAADDSADSFGDSDDD